uniref:ACO2 n=1 Tax=Carthamus tinctorius TaxID=4222 RepID=A0A2I5UG24_CARTI|nr:ACO2 [Carthamus tinctorius]
MASATNEPHSSYDRLQEVKQVDESKIGVKGLLDSGLTTIPRFFHQPPENLPGPKPKNRPRLTVPVIDLSGERSTVVEEIRRSASTLGFFQIVNHSIPPSLIDSAIDAMKKFFEESNEYKMKFYHREAGKGAAYSTNFDLYQSKAASWRDSLQVRMAPMEPAWDAVPEMCREALAEWDKAVVGLGEELMSILCEGLGVKSDKLKELSCLSARVSVSHYYPQRPQPDLTVGLTAHTDPGVLTVLVQNEVGGLLQVKCGEDWADVEAVPGAVVINIGDLLQMMSNEEYKSVMHRVLANPVEGARVSIAVFFNPSIRENLYGPFPELVSAEKPAVYRQFTYEEYITRFFKKELDGKTLTNFYRIDDTNA